MARFYGSVHGNRGEATRMGTPSSGFSASGRGWDIGGRVTMRADGDRDECTIYATAGSNGYRFSSVLVAVLKEGEDGSVTLTTFKPDGKANKPRVLYKPEPAVKATA